MAESMSDYIQMNSTLMLEHLLNITDIYKFLGRGAKTQNST